VADRADQAVAVAFDPGERAAEQAIGVAGAVGVGGAVVVGSIVIASG
jgi:hypothetical protein